MSSPAIDFRALFDLSPNPYMLLDRDLRYVAANAAYLRTTGSQLEDLIGRPLFDVFPDDPDNPENPNVRMLRDSFARVLATGQPDVLALIPYRVPRIENGVTVTEERFWTATHTAIPDEHGDVAFILQHTVDVTEWQRLKARHERKSDSASRGGQAESSLFERAQRVQQENTSLGAERQHLRGLFEQAPGFMCFVRGPEHVFEIANSAYHQLVGNRHLIGKTVRQAMPDVAGQGFFELLDRVYETREPFVGRGMRLYIERQPGVPADEVFLDFSYQPILDASGAATGILVLGHDVTEQKHLVDREREARAAAEAAEERQRFLAESIPQQVWTAFPDGSLDFVNGRTLEYFGTTSAPVLGTGWIALLHPDDVDASVERWTHSLETGDEYEVEFRLRRADGSYRWHLGRAMPFRDAGGRIVKWFGTNTDLDDLKRTRDLLEKRVEFDQQVIGIVSHDLRNPLNAIGIGTSLLLKRGRLDEHQGRIVARILAANERAGRLVRDFLDFTTARASGRVPINPAKANIRTIAQDAFDEVHLAHADRSGSVEHTGEETVVWDADRISQLLGNLVNNAFQHSPPGGEVRLTTDVDADAVVIAVHNDGPPIAAAEAARLFEPFQRGRDSLTSAAGGVGLGLYIAKQIVESHGGTIDVRSSAESGTVFTVRLPRYVPTADAGGSRSG